MSRFPDEPTRTVIITCNGVRRKFKSIEYRIWSAFFPLFNFLSYATCSPHKGPSPQIGSCTTVFLPYIYEPGRGSADSWSPLWSCEQNAFTFQCKLSFLGIVWSAPPFSNLKHEHATAFLILYNPPHTRKRNENPDVSTTREFGESKENYAQLTQFVPSQQVYVILIKKLSEKDSTKLQSVCVVSNLLIVTTLVFPQVHSRTQMNVQLQQLYMTTYTTLEVKWMYMYKLYNVSLAVIYCCTALTHLSPAT